MNVIFVCLGNICRSPMAYAIARHIISSRALSVRVDSAGTSGWHDGEGMHAGSRRVLRAHGIDSGGFVSKKLTRKLCEQNDLIIAMDSANKRDIIREFGFESKIKLICDYAPELGYTDVPDPWYSGDFDETYTILSTCVKNLLKQIDNTAK